MGSVLQTVARRSTSRTFLRSFGLILAAEAVTILVAWFLLGANVKQWVKTRTGTAVQISQQVAASADWSKIDEIPKDQKTPLSELYRKRVKEATQRYFHQTEGAVYLATVERGEEYNIVTDDPKLSDSGKANVPEKEAYSSGKTTVSSAPISDDSGTYLAAYTPIMKEGKVVGLIGATFDSATLADFKGIVRSSFLLSVIPALVLSLVISYIVASIFVEPVEVFRSIQETVRGRSSHPTGHVKDDRWNKLSVTEKQVAELTRQGQKNWEIAAELNISENTVKKHLQNIKTKTGWSKNQLAVEAQARRAISEEDGSSVTGSR